MTQPRQPDPKPDRNIARPDADRASAGQASFESSESQAQSDRAQGFTQTSGYATSGGNPTKEARPDTERSGYVVGNPHKSDEQIRQHVHERLTQNQILQGDQITVQVEDGIVTLQGSVRNEIQRGELKDLIGSIPEVRELRTELTLSSN